MALVKATSEAIGLAQLAATWDLHVQAAVFVDSSAALAITQRRGCGKLRHVKIGHLWVQEVAARDQVQMRKVRGVENPADLMTKGLVAERAGYLLDKLGQSAVGGSAAGRLHLNTVDSFDRPKVCGQTDLGPRRSVCESMSKVLDRQFICRHTPAQSCAFPELRGGQSVQ